MKTTEQIVQDTVEETVLSVLLKAEALFNRTFPMPLVTLDLVGTSAGRANSREWRLQFNLTLLLENFEDYLSDTIPHEVAHLIADTIYKSRGHDFWWRSIMWKLGLTPSRCHNYDTSRAKTRTYRRFPVDCLCGNHTVTKVILNRMKKGYTYTCTTCNHTLRLRS